MTADVIVLPAASAVSEGTAIETSGLTKRFGGRVAVRDLSIDVPAGRIVGFVGPNGAGKTTTLRMLLGLIRPTSGEARVLGKPISDPASYLDRVGALIETPAFYPTLSGRDNLRVLAVLGGIDAGRIPGLLKTVGLAGRERDQVGGYSLGMKQRLGVAAALLPDPELLVLDEPTNGLDPEGIIEMRELLRTLRAEGRTILVSSHLLGELEQVADWLVVIKDGEAVYTGPTHELTSKREGGYILFDARPGGSHQVAVGGGAAGCPGGSGGRPLARYGLEGHRGPDQSDGGARGNCAGGDAAGTGHAGADVSGHDRE